jgi:diguanylate cyclase (GGDEF)-like protein
MLEHEARTYDVVARVGGDEFLVICPSTGGAGARALAERVRKATPATCGQVLPSGWHQTLSVGISLFPYSAEDPAELLRRADGALYDAKAAGRDVVAVADDVTAAAGGGAPSNPA